MYNAGQDFVCYNTMAFHLTIYSFHRFGIGFIKGIGALRQIFESVLDISYCYLVLERFEMKPSQKKPTPLSAEISKSLSARLTFRPQSGRCCQQFPSGASHFV